MNTTLSGIIAVGVIVGAVFLAQNLTLGAEKITVCHGTGSEFNPFVQITIAKQAWDSGHNRHRLHGDTEGPCVQTSPDTTDTAPTVTSQEGEVTPIASSISVTPTAERPTSLPVSGGQPPD